MDLTNILRLSLIGFRMLVTTVTIMMIIIMFVMTTKGRPGYPAEPFFGRAIGL